MRTGTLSAIAAFLSILLSQAPEIAQAAGAQAMPQAILVDGALVPGLRIPLIHSPNEGQVIVKTIEYPTQKSTQGAYYHFDLCQVNYGELKSTEELSLVVPYLNSNQAECRRINETVFFESDSTAKVHLRQALQAELYKQVTRVSGEMERTLSTKKIMVGPIVGASSFAWLNSLLQKRGARQALTPEQKGAAQSRATNIAMVVSVALQVGSVVLTDWLLDRAAKRRPAPFKVDPALHNDERFLSFKLELPPGISPSAALKALTRAFDQATREADLNRQIVAPAMS